MRTKSSTTYWLQLSLLRLPRLPPPNYSHHRSPLSSPLPRACSLVPLHRYRPSQANSFTRRPPLAFVFESRLMWLMRSQTCWLEPGSITLGALGQFKRSPTLPLYSSLHQILPRQMESLGRQSACIDHALSRKLRFLLHRSEHASWLAPIPAHRPDPQSIADLADLLLPW